MATYNFYLNPDKTSSDGTCPIRLRVSHRNQVAHLNTGLRVYNLNWNTSTQRTIARDKQSKKINLELSRMRLECEDVELDLTLQEKRIDAKMLRDHISARLFPGRPVADTVRPTVRNWFVKFIETKTGRTREIYEATLAKLELFDPHFHRLTFDAVNIAWLQKFDSYMMPTNPSPNARSIHMRNLRAVFNFAILNEVTDCYPFRRFKIKTQKTRHRAMPIDNLRTLLTADLGDSWLARHRDIFALMFYLCGINTIDLLKARPEDVIGGRLEYIRAKTHKPYSVKIEPEAATIIERYKGRGYLLDILDSVANYRNFANTLSHGLHAVCEYLGIPRISPYWARHSWATVAAWLDVPKETIAAGLGHSQNTVTDIYIDFDMRKVDRANRRVIDWVLYGIE